MSQRCRIDSFAHSMALGCWLPNCRSRGSASRWSRDARGSKVCVKRLYSRLNPKDAPASI
jgi:hypothetical protein